ncbi:hypothetical protein PG994_015045 [Apiospora phragmitis]|uniref:Uncharacterized protein n=1 Tax=Apiospora phragmitis TaxID=2905665 RepID=A0ABR1SVC5_9PEZI
MVRGVCPGHCWPAEDLPSISIPPEEEEQLPEEEEEEEEDDDQPPELEPDQSNIENQHVENQDGQDQDGELDTTDQGTPARLRHVKFVPLESDDPIEEGRELAESAEVKLPQHEPAPKLCVNTKPVPSPAPALSEAQQLSELYMQGLLYEVTKDEPHWAGFSFDPIHPSEPIYTIQHATKRQKTKPGAGVAIQGGDYVSDDTWDLLSQFPDVDAFDLVMLDEGTSEMESWAGSDSDWVASE